MPVTTADDLLMTVDEVAAATRLSTKTIRRAEQRGSIAAIRIGRSVRFRSADVVAFVDAHRQRALDDSPAATDAVHV